MLIKSEKISNKKLLDLKIVLFFVSQIESAIAGYLSGFFTGSLLVFVIVAWIAIQASDDLSRPEFIDSLIDTVREQYMEPNQGIFVATFALGFLMAVAGSKRAVESR